MIRKLTYKHVTILSLVLTIFVASPCVMAQRNGQRVPSENQRQEYLENLRNYKHDFFKKDLNLTREQENSFFRAYDQMDEELLKIGDETRALERKISNDAGATDTEIESAARVLFEQKKKEGEVELKYFEEFKKILTKRQLLKLKDTERKFNRALLGNSRKRK